MFCGFNQEKYEKSLDNLNQRMIWLESKNKLINDFDGAILQLNTQLSDLSVRIERIENELRKREKETAVPVKRKVGRPPKSEISLPNGKQKTFSNLLNQEQAAQELGMSSNTLWYHRKLNRIKGNRLGKMVFYEKSEVERFKEELSKLHKVSKENHSKNYKYAKLHSDPFLDQVKKSWLTTKEAAKFLKMPISTLKDWIKHSRINFKKLGSLRYFSKEELESENVQIMAKRRRRYNKAKR